MQFQHLPFFLGAVAVWSQVATAIAGAENITILDESDLRADAAHVFLSCLNASNVTYQLFVEDGATIVYPPNNRTYDFEGVDQWLEQCMMMTSRTVVAAAMDSINPSYGYLNSIPATEATYAWLMEQGARGLNVTGTMPVTDESSLFARGDNEMEENLIEGRSFTKYWGYLSNPRQCPNLNAKICIVGNCIVRTEVWRSVKFTNPSALMYLKMEIWPHHRCSTTGTDARRFWIGPMESSRCWERRTYAFKGVYTSTRQSAVSWLASLVSL